MFIFGISLGALTLGIWTSSIKTAEVNVYRMQLEIDELMNVVSEKINTVWIEGEGFSSNVSVPDTVASREYDINITSNFIVITIGEERYIKGIITNNVTGTIVSGVNRLVNRGDYIEIINSTA